MLGQVEPQIQFDQFPLRRFKPLQAQVPAIDKRHHVRRDPLAHVPGSLGGSEIAAHGKDGEQVPLGGIANLRVAARQRAKMPGEVCPVLDVGQHVQQVARGHAPDQRLLQGYRAGRDLPGDGALEYRLAVLADGNMLALVGKTGIQGMRGVAQPLA
ncbi:hypothetical protein D3C86_1324090 [compost metagenome]